MTISDMKKTMQLNSEGAAIIKEETDSKGDLPKSEQNDDETVIEAI